jgi:transcriptional regulator with XRE-family HTH domain
LTYFELHGPILAMNLADIGHLVQQRRQVIGLSQDRLAKLSGLSRATIHSLEAGTIKDLGAAKLITVLDLLGLQLGATSQQRPRNALHLVSQTASVSYKHGLEPGALGSALVDGHLPPYITPQVATLLDEAPLSLIVATVEEVAAASQCSTKILWKHMAQWARDLHSPRSAWA